MRSPGVGWISGREGMGDGNMRDQVGQAGSGTEEESNERGAFQG